MIIPYLAADSFCINTSSAVLIDLCQSDEYLPRVKLSIILHGGSGEQVEANDGSQYFSHKFSKFTKVYDFHHVTSSPLFAQEVRLMKAQPLSLPNFVKPIS